MSALAGEVPSIVLFGSGSAVIVDVEESCARAGWRIAGIVKNIEGIDYAAASALVAPPDPALLAAHPVLIPLFSPSNRRKALEHARSLGAQRFAVLVDPTAIVPRQLTIGQGSYVNAGCIVGAQSRFGAFCFVNRGASIGHHAAIGDFASIGPGVVLAGQVEIGEAALIGAGATIAPGVRIGARAFIKAGAVVRRDVPADTTA